MKKADLVRENLRLSRTLLQRILKDPTYLDEVPEDAHLIVLPLDNPKVFKANLEQLVALKGRGHKTAIVVVLETAQAEEPRVLVRV